MLIMSHTKIEIWENCNIHNFFTFWTKAFVNAKSKFFPNCTIYVLKVTQKMKFKKRKWNCNRDLDLDMTRILGNIAFSVLPQNWGLVT